MTQAVSLPFARLARATLLATLAIAPWSPAATPPLMAVVAVAAGLALLGTRRFDPPVLLALLAPLPLTQVLALTGAQDLGRSLTLTAISVLGWCCAAVVTQLGRVESRRLLGGLVAIGVVVAATSLTSVGSMASHSGGSVVEGRLQGPFAQPNELGSWCALLLPVAVAAHFATRRRSLRALLALGCLPLAAGLALSLSRGAWAGAAGALAVLAVCIPQVRRRVYGLMVVLPIVLVAAAAAPSTSTLGIVLSRVSSITSPSQSPDDERPRIWDFALRLAGEHPSSGVGAGAVPTAAADPSSGLAVVAPEHAHNLPLTVLSEGGIPGLLALGLALVAGALVLRRGVGAALTPAPVGGETRASRRALQHRDWTLVGPLAALTGAMVHGLIDVPWGNPALTLTVWVLAGSLAAAHHSQTAPPRERSAVSQTPTEPTEHRTRRSAAERTARQRGPLVPTVFAGVALVVLAVAVVALPTRYEATAVVGVRTQTDVPATSDDLRLISQQYAVVISNEALVDEVAQGADLADDATSTSSVDPDTTTIRVVASATDRADASKLANGLADEAVERSKDDTQVDVRPLSRATPEFAEKTPPRLLYLGIGTVAIGVATLGLWLLRRSA